MAAERLRVTEASLNDVTGRCRQVLGSGGVIVYPTDTLYALGADPRDPGAVRRLFEIKGRSPEHPVLLLIAERSAVRRWAAEVPAVAERMMDRFWPGPLTLVFAARPDVLPELTAGTGTIGLRVPGDPLTRAILSGVGGVLTGTSANRSGEPAPRAVSRIMEMIGDRVDLVLDAGDARAGLPSTVLDVSASRPRVIRSGALDPSALF